jgi:NAD(P)H-dependent FMN reductase
MRIMLRWLHAWPVPEQLAVGHVKEAFDDHGNLTQKDTKDRLQALVTSVLNTATMLNS